jgi:hypothetical protein
MLYYRDELDSEKYAKKKMNIHARREHVYLMCWLYTYSLLS